MWCAVLQKNVLLGYKTFASVSINGSGSKNSGYFGYYAGPVYASYRTKPSYATGQLVYSTSGGSQTYTTAQRLYF
ncbi:MAG: hypothetical protein HOQ05_07600 [Corynebacteriales bacterium]|nr:hypothetical protein [Mycobacteriales bacterium]